MATVSGTALPLSPDADVATGDDIVLAVRPEHLSVGGGEATLEATVSTVEFLGDAYRAHCDWRDRTLLVTTDERLEPGERIDLGVDADRVYLIESGVPDQGGRR